AIVKGQNVPKAGIPESFKVLIKELQSLCLDVKVLDKEGEEIDLKQNFDDEEPDFVPREFEEKTVNDGLEGFGLQDENGDDIVDESGDTVIEEESVFDDAEEI
ncbi:MAG: hypothetical protein ACI4QV_05165, partial [Acutalibacteraceae bacterium]